MQNQRIHISLAVRDLAASVQFYERLLGAEPTKRRPGYAKFAPANLGVNLSLMEQPGVQITPAPGEHWGVQVPSSDDVTAASRRLAGEGLRVRDEEGVTCCYARQDKAWVTDPDGRPWEIFAVLEDTVTRDGPGKQVCCPAAVGA